MLTDQLLPTDTRMGGVSLDVGDVDAMTRFYREVQKLLPETISDAGSVTELGRGGETLVTPAARPRPATQRTPIGRAVPHRTAAP